MISQTQVQEIPFGDPSEIEKLKREQKIDIEFLLSDVLAAQREIKKSFRVSFFSGLRKAKKVKLVQDKDLLLLRNMQHKYKVRRMDKKERLDFFEEKNKRFL